MSGHTPGPWAESWDYRRVSSSTTRVIGFAVGPNVVSEGVAVGDVGDPVFYRPTSKAMEQIEADARLIAVAPELYDAMKVIIAGFEKGIFVRNTDNDHDPMWLRGIAVQIAALAKGQQAIEKAEGAKPSQRKICYQLTVWASTPIAEDNENVDYHTLAEATSAEQQRAVERQINLILKRSDLDCNVELVEWNVEEDS